MSYFDHVKCHHCGAMLNPDNLSAGMACPSCGGQLSLSDLFGVADAFSEHDQPEATLDDLLAPQKAYADDPLKEFAQQQHAAHAERQAARRRARQGGGGPASHQPSSGHRSVASPPSASRGPTRPGLPQHSSSTGMVHRPRQGDAWDDEEDEEVGGTPSALELMRKMKKGR